MTTEYDISEYILNNLIELQEKYISSTLPRGYEFMTSEVAIEGLSKEIAEVFNLNSEEMFLLFESERVNIVLTKFLSKNSESDNIQKN